MASNRATGASLKLSTSDAVNEIKKLVESISKMKKEMTDLKDEEVAINVVIRNKGFQQMIDKLTKDLQNVGVVAQKSGDQIGTSISKGAKKAEQEVSQTTTKIVRDVSKAEKAMSKLDKSLGGMPSTIKEITKGVASATKEFVGFGKEGNNALNSIAEGVRSAGFLTQSASSGISQLRGIAVDAFSSIRNVSRTVFEAIGLDIKGMVTDAVDQEEKLQLAEIGLKNMFGGDTAKYLDRIKETARVSASLNAGDLADYISQIAPVSSNFDQAFNASLGIIKTVAYGGGDPSSQMGYVVKNIRDVLAKGTAQKMDINQFNRAMPLLAKTLEARGLQQFVKDGQLEINKNNIGDLMDAFASLNDPNAPQYAILEQMSHTLAGAREIFSETVTQQINQLMEDAGIFEFIQDSLSGEPAEEVGKVLEELGKGIKEFLDAVDWNVVREEIGEAWQEIKDTFGEFGKEVKNLMGVSGKNGATQFFVTLIRVIKEFIKGIIQGGQEIAKFLGWLKARLGDEGMDQLANTLGRLVTQGWLLEKAFSAASSVILTLANGLFMFSNLGGKVGSLFSGLGNIGTMAGLGGGIGAAKFASGMGLVGKAGAAKLVASSALQGAGLGALFFGIGQAAGSAIEGLELFGEESVNVGEGVKTVGDVAGGAILGLFVGGPWGALIGGIAGAIKGLKDWKEALDKYEAERTEKNILEIKESGMKEVADAVLQVYRQRGGEIDLDTKAGVYAYNQLTKYLEETPIADWTAEDAIDELISALYNKQVGEDVNRFTTADNAEFQNAGGRVLDLTRTGDVQQMKELAAIIREFNLVGYSSSSDLEKAPAEKLVEDYLDGQEITEGQLELIKATVEKAKTENAKTTIEVGQDIQDVLDAGVEDPLLDIRYAIYQIMNKVLQETEGDELISPESQLQAYGSKVSGELDKWEKGKGGFLGIGGDGDRSKLVETFGNDYARTIYQDLAQASNSYYLRSQDKSLSAEERAAAKKDYDTVTEFLKKFAEIDPNDYATLLQLAKDVESDLTDNVLKLTQQSRAILKGPSWANRSTTTITTVVPPLSFSTGGRLKPIYRASGSGFGERGVDTIPAMLQPGEFIQRVSAVKKAGLGVMTALNRGDLNAAYRALGSKINQRISNNNARNYGKTWNTHNRDSHNQTTIFNNSPSAVVDTYQPFSNVIAGA